MLDAEWQLLSAVSSWWRLHWVGWCWIFLLFVLNAVCFLFVAPFFPEKGVESRVFSSPKSEGCSVLQTPFWGSQLLFLVPPGGV